MQQFTRSIWILAVLGLGLLPIGIALSLAGSAGGPIAFLSVIKDGSIDGLRLASAAVVSPDGAHVYVLGEGDDALALFSRNPVFGTLDYVELYQNGVNGVSGLNTPLAAAISPDGKHVYVASRDDDAAAVFSRDSATGKLTFIEAQKDGLAGVDGLDGAYAVAVSPDGAHVYAAGENDNAVAVFSRSALTGSLTFVEVQRDGVGGVDGLGGARGVTVSPDGAHVYAAGSVDDTVAAFSRNATSGALTFVEIEKDSVGGVDGLNGARAVTVSPDNLHVYAAGFIDGAVAVFSRDALSGALTYVERQKDGTSGVDGLAGAIAVLVSPSGEFVYAAGYNDDAIAIFSRSAASGALTYAGQARNGVDGVKFLDGPNWLAASLDGAHLYVPGRAVNALVSLGRDSQNGGLSFIDSDVDGAGVEGLAGAGSLAFSPDGNQLYVTGAADNGLAVLSRNRLSGGLAFSEARLDVFPIDGLWAASSVVVSPDGANVYAAGQQDSGLAVFSRDVVTGSLTFVEALLDGTGGVDGLSNPEALAISPDGASLYVAATGDNAIGVFSRNPLSGTLTYVEMQQDGVGGVDGLQTTQAVAVSPDSKHVYATSTDEDAVAVFSRQAGSGALTFVEFKQDGDGDIDGLDFARGLAFSPDGAYLYVAGELDDALAVFSRDSNSGALTFVEVQKNGVAGVDGLDGAYGVAVSPLGNYVYVASESGDSLAVFSRDAASGLLTFLAVQRDGVNGADGLDGARAVTVSPDGRHVYVAAFRDNAAAVFQGEHRVFLPVILK
jgi:6-phosphogluconolactonase (cycloisomerase 2 family)